MRWQDLFSWAWHAVQDQAKKTAIEQVQKATENLSEQVEKHAPDLSHAIQDQLTKAATTAIAGILSKKG